MITYTDESQMPFGMHQGTKLANVPAGYLIYLYDGGLKDGPLRAYIKANLDVLKMEAKRQARNERR